MGGRIQCSDDVDLAKIVEEKAPKRILTLGSHAANTFAEYLERHPQAQLTHIAEGDWLTPIASGLRFDFTFLSGVQEQMSKVQACHLLTQLRDVSQFLYTKVPLGKAWLNHASLWEKNDMRGLGFDLVSLSAEHGRPVGLFGYDSRAYKSEAEWLNSKYWAQPD